MQQLPSFLPVLPVLAAGFLITASVEAQTLPDTWNRRIDWVDQPASSAGTSQGNPSPDSGGNLVWHYEYATGGGLGSADPWYEEPATALVWDEQWYQSVGAWVASNNFGTVIKNIGLTHIYNSSATPSWYSHTPIVRWNNATGQAFDLGIAGTLRLGWNSNSGPYPADVDVVIAHRSAATGSFAVLFSANVNMPGTGPTPSLLQLPIDLVPIAVEPGDDILVTHRVVDSVPVSRWVSMNDALCFVREPVGTRYCGPGNPNSSAYPGIVSATGSARVADGDLTLLACHLPVDSFAFFITSQVQAFTPNPAGSAGNLCLGGSIGRFVGPGQIQNAGSDGSIELALDLGAQPTPTGLVQVQAGETWNFQCWHRDVGSTSNFTDALSITFR